MKKKDAITALTSASGFIRREIGQKISCAIRRDQFKLDESIGMGSISATH